MKIFLIVVFLTLSLVSLVCAMRSEEAHKLAIESSIMKDVYDEISYAAIHEQFYCYYEIKNIEKKSFIIERLKFNGYKINYDGGDSNIIQISW